MNWEAVFFDFDGVIADSADIKTKAFAQMFSAYGDDVKNKIVQYHLEHEGISRFEKFRYFYENILLKNISEAELQILGNVFSRIVLEKVLIAPFVKGALDTLKHLKNHGIASYVVSGTPHTEINYIINQRNLSEYFKEVHGSPKQKHQIISDILKSNNYLDRHCLLIGDALSDYNAACRTGICFLGIIRGSEPSKFPTGTNISSIITYQF